MRYTLATLLLAAAAASPLPASAQVVVADKGDHKLTIGGYLQGQYTRIDTRAGAPLDTTRVRRMVLTLQGTTTPHWMGTFQFDLAPATLGDHVIVKDANVQYLGWRDRGLTLTIGNQKPPFSRSLLTSSARRSFVERPFTGDRSLGSLGRALGVKLDGSHRSKGVAWSAEIASSLQSPRADQIRIDGIAEADAEWNEGVLAVGRVEYQPHGEVAREQADIAAGPWHYNVAIAAYHWQNDGDRNAYTADGVATTSDHADASSVNGFEASAAIRGGGWSVDAEVERIASHAIDPAFTGGLYSDGVARIVKASIEAGRMVVARHLEVVGAYDVADAGTYDRPWQRAAAGLSWYAAGHNVKFQILHRISRHDRGIADARSVSTFAQAQFAF